MSSRATGRRRSQGPAVELLHCPENLQRFGQLTLDLFQFSFLDPWKYFDKSIHPGVGRF
ncbi:hypothetical protein NQZ68_027626 [Dissostichus eleginoides]|nr:hypothetical protein NQZ68_027626 [Dissostichus eleginoides]